MNEIQHRHYFVLFKKQIDEKYRTATVRVNEKKFTASAINEIEKLFFENEGCECFIFNVVPLECDCEKTVEET